MKIMRRRRTITIIDDMVTRTFVYVSGFSSIIRIACIDLLAHVLAILG